jgi:hypothetical protein
MLFNILLIDKVLIRIEYIRSAISVASCLNVLSFFTCSISLESSSWDDSRNTGIGPSVFQAHQYRQYCIPNAFSLWKNLVCEILSRLQEAKTCWSTDPGHSIQTMAAG